MKTPYAEQMGLENAVEVSGICVQAVVVRKSCLRQYYIFNIIILN